MTTKMAMSFLIWSKRFRLYRQQIITCDVSQVCNGNSYQLNRLNNLKRLSRFLSNSTLASRLNLSVTDSSIRKYLDYLSDAYQQNSWKENSFSKMIDIKSVANILEERINIREDLKHLQDLVKEDEEITKLADAEEEMYERQLDNLDQTLIQLILHNVEKENYKNVILEITAGVGGQEAMLFVKDLYEMYLGYADYLGIESETLELDKTDKGGFRHTSILLKGNLAFEKFRYEGGVHRVQRVPETEKSGRIHTSTASVAILPEPTDIEIQLNEKDLKIDTMRSSGAGGQHVNTTDSAIRITHLPTGVVVTCETQKSQIKNKEIALLKLRTCLYEKELNKQVDAITDLRKRQMGLGRRNEKIRTYNYNQDRITDHRIENGTMHNLKIFMAGGGELEELADRLQKNTQKQILINILKEIENKVK